MESYKQEKKEYDEVAVEPVSPTGQYFNSSVLSISVLGVLETEVPFDSDDSLTFSLLKDVLLPINPRFSSVMIGDENGQKQWKKVEVNLEDHVNNPIFPAGLPPESYDGYLADYLTKLALENLPQTRPLWEIHIIKYPTSNAAGNIIFKIHHALGDGFSLMGALLSCLQSADNPSLPLTFPSIRSKSNSDTKENGRLGFFRSVPRVLSSVFNTIVDFGWSILMSSFLEDDRSPIRSGDVGVQFRPMTITTMTFSIEQLKEIKAKLGVTINDVIVGIVFLGARQYMEEMSHGSSNLQSTALVLLNTRSIEGYKSVEEMANPKAEGKVWGNHFCFLHVSIPELNSFQGLAPVEFVLKAGQVIKRKRNSLAVHLNGSLLEAVRKYRDPEAAARYVHSTLKNSSMTISNLIGPAEQMALANHRIKGFYFMSVGSPQNLTITMVSYMGKLRVAVGAEKDHIDSHKFKSCIENAFDMIFNSTCKSPLSS